MGEPENLDEQKRIEFKPQENFDMGKSCTEGYLQAEKSLVMLSNCPVAYN